jgi:hypothetical protein
VTRDWSPLVRGWTWSGVIALALWAFVRYVVPPAEELVRPVYALALIPGIAGSWRWARPRRTPDRRGGDRRQSPRRQDEDGEHGEHAEHADGTADGTIPDPSDDR